MATISPAAFSSTLSTVTSTPEDLCVERYGEVVVNHCEKASDFLVLVVAIDGGLSYQGVEPRPSCGAHNKEYDVVGKCRAVIGCPSNRPNPAP